MIVIISENLQENSISQWVAISIEFGGMQELMHGDTIDDGHIKNSCNSA
jgi:hypothetical protein